MTAPGASDAPYVPVKIAPDPARDARVAARRADAARRAGAALDRLLGDIDPANVNPAYLTGYRNGFWDGYSECRLQHNRAYGVPVCTCKGDPDSCRSNTHWPDWSERTITPHYGVATDADLDLRSCCSTLKTHEHGDWCRNGRPS